MTIPIWLFVLLVIFAFIGGIMVIGIITTIIMGLISSVDYSKSEENECPYFIEKELDNEKED